jgi:hypothetical protein
MLRRLTPGPPIRGNGELRSGAKVGVVRLEELLLDPVAGEAPLVSVRRPADDRGSELPLCVGGGVRLTVLPSVDSVTEGREATLAFCFFFPFFAFFPLGMMKSYAVNRGADLDSTDSFPTKLRSTLSKSTPLARWLTNSGLVTQDQTDILQRLDVALQG